MKKKQKKNSDVYAMMVQIQGQLAVLDQKLDSFMTKSLTELAQALAASKPVVRPQVHTPPPVRPVQNEYPLRRPMYAIICYECGKDSELPFKPISNRPVYCRDCFAKRKGRTAPLSVVKPLAAALPAVSVQQAVPVSAPPAKAKKRKAVGKPVKAKKKVVKRKTTIAKKSAAKKKAVARKKTTTARKKTTTAKRTTTAKKKAAVKGKIKKK